CFCYKLVGAWSILGLFVFAFCAVYLCNLSIGYFIIIGKCSAAAACQTDFVFSFIREKCPIYTFCQSRTSFFCIKITFFFRRRDKTEFNQNAWHGTSLQYKESGLMYSPVHPFTVMAELFLNQ